MARCKLCSKKGLFLKLNNDGLCENCAAEVQKERIKKQKEVELAKIEEVKNSILLIPNFAIHLSEEKRNRQVGFDTPKFSNITPKGKYDEFVVFDTETTGLTPSKDRIIELAAIKVKDGVAVSKFHTYVNPERPIPKEASAINHITDEMVENAPKIGEVLESFEEFVGNSILIAHNLEFDLKFLYYSGSKLLETNRKYIDTYSQARRILKKNEYGINSIVSGEVANYKLDNLCDFFGITLSDAHSAMSDTFATVKLFLTLVYWKQN